MQRIRVGIVGCGEVTQIIHLPALHHLADRFEVTALCDVSAQVLQEIGNHWRVEKRFLDFRELLAQDDVDAVLVANPNAYHAQVTLEVMAAGKHVLVEKPMCMNLREADEIIEQQQQTSVVVQVGYMRRYAPAFTQACELVRALGDIKLARVHDVIGQNALIIEQTSRVSRGQDIDAELLKEAQDLDDQLVAEALGDAPLEVKNAYRLMLGLSSHDISAMREILGKPKGVLYATQRSRGRYLSAAFDYGSFVCQFETGVDDIARFDGHIEVFGVDQVIKVQYDTPYVRNLPTRLEVTKTNGHGGVSVEHLHPTWGDPFVTEWLAFYDNISQHRVPKTDPRDARDDLELFEQMARFMT